MFGMHLWPMLPSGQVASRAGTIMAGAIQFDITIRGRGGHAAMPHLTADPVVAAAAIVTALQVRTRRGRVYVCVCCLSLLPSPLMSALPPPFPSLPARSP